MADGRKPGESGIYKALQSMDSVRTPVAALSIPAACARTKVAVVNSLQALLETVEGRNAAEALRDRYREPIQNASLHHLAEKTQPIHYSFYGRVVDHGGVVTNTVGSAEHPNRAD